MPQEGNPNSIGEVRLDIGVNAEPLRQGLKEAKAQAKEFGNELEGVRDKAKQAGQQGEEASRKMSGGFREVARDTRGLTAALGAVRNVIFGVVGGVGTLIAAFVSLGATLRAIGRAFDDHELRIQRLKKSSDELSSAQGGFEAAAQAALGVREAELSRFRTLVEEYLQLQVQFVNDSRRAGKITQDTADHLIRRHEEEARDLVSRAALRRIDEEDRERARAIEEQAARETELEIERDERHAAERARIQQEFLDRIERINEIKRREKEAADDAAERQEQAFNRLREDFRSLAESQRAAARALDESISFSMGRLVQIAEQIKQRIAK